FPYTTLFRPTGSHQRFGGAGGQVAAHQRYVTQGEEAQHTRAHDGPRTPVEPLVIHPVRRRLDPAEEVHQLDGWVVEAVEAVLDGPVEQSPPLTRRQAADHRDDRVGEGVLGLGELAQTPTLPLGPPNVAGSQERGGEAEPPLAQQLRVRQSLLGRHRAPSYPRTNMRQQVLSLLGAHVKRQIRPKRRRSTRL